MKLKKKPFWINYWVGYLVVTLVGIGHTCFNWLVLGMGTMADGPINTMYDIEAYAATVPWHPLYNIILWPMFAYLYFKAARPDDVWKTAFKVGGLWALITIVFDVFGWVLIPHPWAMTWKEMYIDYQPWITLIYLTIFISPFIAALFYSKKNGKAVPANSVKDE